MKKKRDHVICAKCGGTIEPSASFCSVCGEPAPVPEPAPEPAAPKQSKQRGRGPGVLSVLGSILFGLLLAVSVVALTGLLFLHALNQNVPIPAAGPLSEELLAGLLASWRPFVLGGLLVLIPLLLVVLIHRRRIRRAFFTLGIFAVLAAVLNAVFGCMGARMVGLMSEEWQGVLMNTTAVFQEFTLVCAVILAALGAGCLSVYACINAVKGEVHEKDT